MARRNRALVLLTFALASGALAAFLALRYLRNQTAPIDSPQQQREQLVVAARALPVGAIIGEQDVRTIDYPGTLPPGFIGNTQMVIGRGLVAPVEPNEPIMQGKLAAEGLGGGLPVLIEDGMRAISIAVDQVVGVAGFVLPTSRVDVLLTMANPNGNNEQATKIIMQNVRTLAAGQQIQQDREGKPMPVPVVTLLVTPEQAETLTLATSQGRIQLALRGSLDTTTVATRGTRLGALFTGLGGAPRSAPRRAAPVRTGNPVPTPTTVEVYRGGVRSLQQF